MCTFANRTGSPWLTRVARSLWLAVFFALASSFGANAGSLAVSPLRLIYSPGSGILSLTVENNGQTEALVQTETFAWSQAGSEHKLSPTEDVVAVPPVFRLAAGAQQLVRVGLTHAITDKLERTFRLTVTEVPTVVAPGNVAVAIRHSLPIFVRPASPIASMLHATLSGSGQLQITNRGSQHLRIHRWRLRDNSLAIIAEGSGPGYLLAGAVQVIATVKAPLSGPTLLEADSDNGTLKIAAGQ